MYNYGTVQSVTVVEAAQGSKTTSTKGRTSTIYTNVHVDYMYSQVINRALTASGALIAASGTISPHIVNANRYILW